MSARITIAFSVSAWSRALGVDFKTLSTRLSKAGLPNRGQIPAQFVFTAMFGKRDASIIRLNNARAEAIEQKNKVVGGQLVELPAVDREFWQTWLWPVRQEVETMPAKLAPLLGGEEAQRVLTQWAATTTDLFLKQRSLIDKAGEEN